MKLVAPIKLLCSPAQREALRATLHTLNQACDWLSAQAFSLRCFSAYKLHKLFYRALRSQFGLSAQMAVRVLGKVAEAYAKDASRRTSFRETGAFPFDGRLYSFLKGNSRLSLRSLRGRLTLPFVAGAHQQALLCGQRGEADLVYRKGTFFLHISVEVKPQEGFPPRGTLGGDLGLANVLYDSDGEHYSGEKLEEVRTRYAMLRAALQRAGTPSAKRHLKRLAGKEASFQRDQNHKIAKRLVRKAKDTARRIALEELKGIRERVTARKAQRARLHSWSFSQLRKFITYKALLAGVLVVVVDPRNTSRKCPACGHVARENRKSQAEFVCVRCGLSAHADWVGATNIARRADVSQPIVSRQPGETVHPETSGPFSETSPVL
jgi:putative transposase